MRNWHKFNDAFVCGVSYTVSLRNAFSEVSLLRFSVAYR